MFSLTVFKYTERQKKLNTVVDLLGCLFYIRASLIFDTHVFRMAVCCFGFRFDNVMHHAFVTLAKLCEIRLNIVENT